MKPQRISITNELDLKSRVGAAHQIFILCNSLCYESKRHRRRGTVQRSSNDFTVIRKRGARVERRMRPFAHAGYDDRVAGASFRKRPADCLAAIEDDLRFSHIGETAPQLHARSMLAFLRGNCISYDRQV